MRTNPAATALLLTAVAAPASAGEIYSFRAANYLDGTDVSTAIPGVLIRLVGETFGTAPGRVEIANPPTSGVSFNVPSNLWLRGGDTDASCSPDSYSLLELRFEQPIVNLEIVTYGTINSGVYVCGIAGGQFFQEYLPQTIDPPDDSGGIKSYRSAAMLSFGQPVERFIVSSASGFGITEFRAEGISFVDEPIPGALLLGGVAALAGLRRRRG